MLNQLLSAGKDVRVTVPIVVLAGLLWLGFKADELTVSYLGQFFVTQADAQELAKKVLEIDGKVDGLSGKIDSNRVKVIETEIFRLVIERCKAAGQLRTLLTTQITGLVSEWRTLTNSPGTPPTVVECGDIG